MNLDSVARTATSTALHNGADLIRAWVRGSFRSVQWRHEMLAAGSNVMSFRAFDLAIMSPALRHIAEHWNDARGSRAMPSWDDIRPSQITAELPIIWSYKYDRTAEVFTGRLAGNRIEEVFGKSFRGSPMAEL